MEKDKVTVTEVSHGPKVTAVWHIKGFKDEFNYKLIKKSGKCVVKPGLLIGSDHPVEVSFWFEENEYDADDEPTERSGLYKINTWIDLYVTILSSHRQFMFTVDVDILDDDLSVKNRPVEGQLFNIDSDFDAQAELLKSKFLLISQKEYNRYKGAKSSRTNVRPNDLRLRFSVSLIHFINTTEASSEALESNAALARDLKQMFTSNENFPDLKIITKDNKTLPAHKFILGARSLYLKNLIEKDGSGGSITLDFANERTMTFLLQWMYTGETELDGFPMVVEEILMAAVKLETVDLLKMLDRKLIRICNVENMFDLFSLARRLSLSMAMVDISNFIKMNIGKLVLEDMSSG